jgi:hypothetical protein
MGFSYSLTCVRSSMLADFRMASAICRTKWNGLARPLVAVDLSRLCSLTRVLSHGLFMPFIKPHGFYLDC